MSFRQYRWFFVFATVLAIVLLPLQNDWIKQLHSGKVGLPVVAQTQPPNANELRWEGQDLVLEQRCDEALVLLAQAIDLYHAENANPDISEIERHDNLISELMAYSNMARCYGEMNDYANLLAVLRRSINIHDQLADVPYLNSGAEAGLVALSDWLDTWRGRLTNDTERIEALDVSDSFFSDLTWLLVKLEDFGDALVASEKGRARAIADLLTVDQFENPSDRATLALAPTLEKIQRTAQDHQITLVEYAIMSSEAFEEDSLFVWVVEPSGTVHFKSIPLGSEDRSLKTSVSNSRKALGSTLRGGFVPIDSQPEAQKTALQDLYNILITPIEGWLPNDEQAPIAFIPKDELFLVPFAALLNENKQPLITTHTLLTAPSIQVLELTYQRQLALQDTIPTNDAESLLVGNPTMPPMPDSDGNLKPLQPLPGAENEVREIARLLRSTPLLEGAATETIVKQRIGSAPIIHLATHGLLEYGAEKDDQPPGAIALASGNSEDGLLTSSEILGLNLNADLVVLSACDTGLGNITGDGVIGLSRALITAGTPSVIVSLWSVPDAPTADLMVAFYRQLQQGQDKAQSLRQAMLETMTTHPDPADWAAFTLVGTAEYQ